MSAGSLSFSAITSPLAPQEFASKYWTRRGVHLQNPARTFDDYFGWDALNTVLNANGLFYPKVVVSRKDIVVPSEEFTDGSEGSQTVNAQAVVDLLRDGASFSIRAAESHWAPLRTVVDCFYDALLESVHANVYCSPANIQGFRTHYDLHEVFILQIEGAKHWRVFEPTTEAPVRPWKAEDAPGESAQPYLDVVLRRGDVLYVPRGHWHDATAQDSISLHITVGVTCRTGTSVLDWLTGELTSEAAWRRNVPLMSTASADGRFVSPAGFDRWANDLRQSLIAKASDPDVFERFCRETLVGIRPRSAVNLPLQANEDPLPLAGLVFLRPPGRQQLVSANGDGVVVSVGGSEIHLAGFNQALIRKVFGASSFTLQDVKTWDPAASMEDVSDLLTTLVQSGLLMARPLHG